MKQKWQKINLPEPVQNRNGTGNQFNLNMHSTVRRLSPNTANKQTNKPSVYTELWRPYRPRRRHRRYPTRCWRQSLHDRSAPRHLQWRYRSQYGTWYLANKKRINVYVWCRLRKRTLLRNKYHRPWSDATHHARVWSGPTVFVAYEHL